MCPLSEYPLMLSVNCSSLFQQPWLNLRFNHFLRAGFQFMILQKPDSIEATLPYIPSRSGISHIAISHIVVLTLINVLWYVWKYLCIWCLQTKNALQKILVRRKVTQLFSSFPRSSLLLNLFRGEHCYWNPEEVFISD